MNIQLVRNATLLLSYHGKTILVDPMLAEKGSNPPIPNTDNQQNNPLVSLPMNVTIEELCRVDGIIITHMHRDHFDEQAAQILPKTLPVICQTEDADRLAQLGFTNLSPIKSQITWNEITISKTSGQHGTGEIAEKMAPVSGFVLQSDTEPSLYLAGDTIWCSDVADVLDTHQPDVAVVNAGAAQFLIGEPITMTKEDVQSVCVHSPQLQVIAVHMESINHCFLTRKELRAFLIECRLSSRVSIPLDGEVVPVSV